MRDGDGWIINGSKMFTSNAQNAAYVFLITNTDPSAPKHQSLTMFLVPLDSPGVEIQPLRTVDGDRTNITYYSDVRVDDRYRIGEVNGGWTVLRDALNDEHGTVERGRRRSAEGRGHGRALVLLAEAIDKVAGTGRRRRCREIPAGSRHRPDGSGDEHAGHVRPGRQRADHARRVAGPDGHPGSRLHPAGRAHGAQADGGAEYVFRLAGPTGIYGGTLEVFRNMIAQHALGLGRPAYAPPAKRPT